MEASKLSANDSSVLSALFDPESSLSSTVQVDNSTLEDQSPSSLKRLGEQERLALKSINQEQPQLSDIEHSIAQLTEIITVDPSYASAWNNRAQARRMLVRDDDLPRNPGIVAEIFQDLAQAIALSTPTGPKATLSGSDAKVLASAHTHRGYLLLLASKSEDNREMLAAVPHVNALSTEMLEEAASRELVIGGRYGNETARQLAVKTNPYAKLCGSIVREALAKEISDFYQPHVALYGANA
ncbi:uncharacterized protein Z520_03702 [Fonsecaea multimorphosa CBS 102226]|uniref:Uncharacterized protein n=1 Tax=Fonsecaea multimorphosa CBS 102226 TaxID=1442371 RepID=A0A0D2HGK9_9EURO|nr:uncharacterized protein Z520_03702 [Fonsecaea multimorphosa CBS 102226]KIY01036.1 hypothetical protein Z520_03702 [Fonsecaea multimorphosa CBS 102226]OAL27620.1 hypothetical protein AYO22_03524 [Fonsecaea multimorphosa]